MATRKNAAREQKPVAAAAAQALESGTAKIADEARTQVTKGQGSVSMTASVIPPLGAKGHALAALVIKEVNNHGTAWNRFYHDLLALAPEGRRTFRMDLQDLIKGRAKLQMTEYELSLTDSKKVTRSQTTRLSEFVKIAEAIDAAVPMNKEWPFSVAVAKARLGLAAQGKSDNRGKANKKTPAEKLISYLIRDHAQPDGSTVNYIALLGDTFIDTCRKAVVEYQKALKEKEQAKASTEDVTKLLQKSVRATPPARKNAKIAKPKGRTIRQPATV